MHCLIRLSHGPTVYEYCSISLLLLTTYFRLLVIFSRGDPVLLTRTLQNINLSFARSPPTRGILSVAIMLPQGNTDRTRF